MSEKEREREREKESVRREGESERGRDGAREIEICIFASPPPTHVCSYQGTATSSSSMPHRKGMFAAFDAVIRVDACCARVVLPGTGHVKMSELPDDDEALCFVIGPSLGLLLDSVVLTITPYKFHMWWQGDETPSKKVSFSAAGFSGISKCCNS